MPQQTQRELLVRLFLFPMLLGSRRRRTGGRFTRNSLRKVALWQLKKTAKGNKRAASTLDLLALESDLE